MMAALRDDMPPVGVIAAARARSMSASVRPAPNAPIFRKLRRVTPSQKPCLAPQMVNMAIPPKTQTAEPLDFQVPVRSRGGNRAPYQHANLGAQAVQSRK